MLKMYSLCICAVTFNIIFGNDEQTDSSIVKPIFSHRENLNANKKSNDRYITIDRKSTNMCTTRISGKKFEVGDVNAIIGVKDYVNLGPIHKSLVNCLFNDEEKDKVRVRFYARKTDDPENKDIECFTILSPNNSKSYSFEWKRKEFDRLVPLEKMIIEYYGGNDKSSLEFLYSFEYNANPWVIKPWAVKIDGTFHATIWVKTNAIPLENKAADLFLKIDDDTVPADKIEALIDENFNIIAKKVGMNIEFRDKSKNYQEKPSYVSEEPQQGPIATNTVEVKQHKLIEPLQKLDPKQFELKQHKLVESPDKPEVNQNKGNEGTSTVNGTNIANSGMYILNSYKLINTPIKTNYNMFSNETPITDRNNNIKSKSISQKLVGYLFKEQPTSSVNVTFYNNTETGARKTDLESFTIHNYKDNQKSSFGWQKKRFNDLSVTEKKILEYYGGNTSSNIDLLYSYQKQSIMPQFSKALTLPWGKKNEGKNIIPWAIRVDGQIHVIVWFKANVGPSENETVDLFLKVNPGDFNKEINVLVDENDMVIAKRINQNVEFRDKLRSYHGKFSPISE